MKTIKVVFQLFIFNLFSFSIFSQSNVVFPQNYNVLWDTQSQNSSESMPCGGGDIGMNVWVENGEILLYLSRSGAFDENNVFPKFGRVRMKLLPNPFDNCTSFRQELKLEQGYVEITGKKNKQSVVVKCWVDVFRPIIHIESNSNQKFVVEAHYENWRTENREWLNKGEARASLAYRDSPMKALIKKDSIRYNEAQIEWFHRNSGETIFDFTVQSQDLESIKNKLWNPLENLTFGGIMKGTNMTPSGNKWGKYADTNFKSWGLKSAKPDFKNEITIYMHVDNSAKLEEWKKGLYSIVEDEKNNRKTAFTKTQNWWKNFWQRSYIIVNPENVDTNSKAWQVGRNYQLFRYQLGCNAYGKYPTKFNGGLFTFDPTYVDASFPFTPDHRDWGGGTFTAQNQRLIYWPMLKSGDFDMMLSQLDFYVNALKNAEHRTQYYWGHKGASFTEQLDLYGLPLATSYGWDRPSTAPKGVEWSKWLEYVWDTSLEFCYMAIEMHQYNGQEISKYIPLIKSCLLFFDEHYQYQALNRGKNALDENGKLILFPGSGAETYKMAYNPSSTIAALQTVTKALLALPTHYLNNDDRQYFEGFLTRIPPLPFRQMQGHKTIAPAEAWARISNMEIPQLYPVFPWRIYGVGKPDLEVTINTWKYGVDNDKQRGYVSWHQDAIFCANLGLTDEAKTLTIKKLENANRRYPTYWGPGHDWVPDHNWGGSGMIGLQDMLMQVDGKRILLFPAWPADWNLTFKLNAPFNTTIEGKLQNGKISALKVIPAERRKDIELMNFEIVQK